MDSFPLSLVVPFILFVGFASTHNRHANSFLGASRNFHMALYISTFLASLTLVGMLILHGYKTRWYAPIVLFPVASIIAGWGFSALEFRIGILILSLAAFIGWPTSAYLSVRAINKIGTPSSSVAQAAWSEDERANAQHFFKAGQFSQAATSIRNRGQAYSAVSPPEIAEILRLERQALMHSQAVHDRVLEKAFPGMAKVYREKFQRSLELNIQGLEKQDSIAIVEGARLHDEWVDWINGRRSSVRIPK